MAEDWYITQSNFELRPPEYWDDPAPLSLFLVRSLWKEWSFVGSCLVGFHGGSAVLYLIGHYIHWCILRPN